MIGFPRVLNEDITTSQSFLIMQTGQTSVNLEVLSMDPCYLQSRIQGRLVMSKTLPAPFGSAPIGLVEVRLCLPRHHPHCP